ncbi:MAG: stage III sporulation protein AB [Firmicutes bacterium]|nr:stage III sporulation protein AB [Alicyclobacillaceae bacterium]MCL6496666.1 stage III sporulation protein AB [Bacillota bacterium]
MIAWAGALAVVVGGVGVGRVLTQPGRDRLRALGEWRRCLEQLEGEVVWRRRPVGEALKLAAGAHPELRRVAERLAQALARPGTDLREAAVAALTQDPRLSAEEARLLSAFLGQVGTVPSGQQAALWDGLRQEWRDLERRVKETETADGRLVQTLCTLAGCAVAIWML